jgi:hypothetical protein
MPILNAAFAEKVRQVWGNPVDVVKLAISETFRFDRSFDHDSQVLDAIMIGIMAGQTASQTPEVFINAFQKYLNEG